MPTELKDRIKIGLDESRMIVLVVQVLLGFECRAAFEPRFEQLPPAAQIMKLVSFGLLAFTLALLLSVPAFHRVAEQGRNTRRCESLIRQIMSVALVPFAAALGFDLAIAALTVLGATAAAVVGVGTAVLALFLWFGLKHVRPSDAARHSEEDMEEDAKPTPLEDKIKQMLTECRIVLPGTQAFLGFQLIAFLTDAFAKLPRADQLLHLAALALVAISGILLMTLPAYHRVAERGEMTRGFHRLGSILLVCAMLPLALGISIDFYVVLNKVTHAPLLSGALGAAVLAMFLAFWFLLPALMRKDEPAGETDYASRSRAKAAGAA
jgi:hypothetical protein